MSPFTNKRADSITALGETMLIQHIRRWLGRSSPSSPFGIGDDCAVMPASRLAQLITVDPVIYGHHFNDEVPARMAGAKLFKRNLSDIAAMGGRPTAAVIALAIDGRVKTAWLREFYLGLATISRRYDVPVVGGDVARLDSGIVATLTLLGEAGGPRVLTRTGARRGDHICVTGRLGGSLPSGQHFKFTPRLAEGQWLTARPEVRSMMDLSDGLAKDLHALTPKGCAAALDPQCIPRRRGCDLQAALCDGEDYELVFCVDSRTSADSLRAAFLAQFPRTRFSCIGRFCTLGEEPKDCVNLRRFHGFEHLRD